MPKLEIPVSKCCVIGIKHDQLRTHMSLKLNHTQSISKQHLQNWKYVQYKHTFRMNFSTLCTTCL